MTSLAKRFIIVGGILAAAGTMSVSRVGAQPATQGTPYATIKYLSAGWAEDVIAVYHNTAIVNPGGCPITNGGYQTDPRDPGHTLFHAMLQEAFRNYEPVAFVIQGCTPWGQPRLIGVVRQH